MQDSPHSKWIEQFNNLNIEAMFQTHTKLLRAGVAELLAAVRNNVEEHFKPQHSKFRLTQLCFLRFDGCKCNYCMYPFFHHNLKSSLYTYACRAPYVL